MSLAVREMGLWVRTVLLASILLSETKYSHDVQWKRLQENRFLAEQMEKFLKSEDLTAL